MSTTTPTTTTSSSSSPSSTSSHANSSTATLYLFTFLATILILVLLSASLVLRSYVLRRRYRQRLNRALADGLFDDLGNGTGQFDIYRRSARRLGPRPIVFVTWLQPADKVDAWSSLSPVAVRCSPLTSPPSSIISSPPSHASPSSPHARPFISQLRIPSPFSLSSRPSSPPPPRQGRSPLHSPTHSIRSPPPTGSSSLTSRTDNDAATLAVSMLVAMPDASSPVHCHTLDTKGKCVDLTQQRGGCADSLSPPSLRRPGARRFGDEGLPLLEFGVVEMTTGDWVWRT